MSFDRVRNKETDEYYVLTPVWSIELSGEEALDAMDAAPWLREALDRLEERE